MKIYIMSKLSEMTKSKFRMALHTESGLSSVKGRPFIDFATYIIITIIKSVLSKQVSVCWCVAFI